VYQGLILEAHTFLQTYLAILREEVAHNLVERQVQLAL
jgi:hypothetical protein